MTVTKFNKQFEQFEDKSPDAGTIAHIFRVIEENGLIIVQDDPDDPLVDLKDLGDGLFEFGVKKRYEECLYGFGISVCCGTISGCGIEEEEWE